MKRSQAIQVLRNSFIYWMNCPETDPYPKTDDEMYSQILKDLENMGMSAPFSHDVYYKTWRDGGTGLEWEEE